MIRPGTFWSGLTTLVVLAVPVLAGLGLLAFGAVYESGHYLGLLAYGLLALGALLGYRAIKAKAGPAGLEVEASRGEVMTLEDLDAAVKAAEDSPDPRAREVWIDGKRFYMLTDPAVAKEANQYPRSSWTSETVTIRPGDTGDMEIVDHYRSKDSDDAPA